VSEASARRAIAWLDVFTDRPFAGNQLAVILDADGLSDEQMQSMARELTISESVFASEGGRAIRIFTPGYELPGAGHPVIGVTHELVRRGAIPASGEWTYRTVRGETAVTVDDGVATMTQPDPQLGVEHDEAAVAAALRIDERDLASVPQVCNTGVNQLFAELRDREALAALHPDMDLVAGLDGAEGIVAWCELGDGEVAQRFFAPLMGIPEDPATGSAAGALGALRVFHGAEPGPLTVRQGDEMGRPSEIRVSVSGEAGYPADVRVGGRAVLLFEGEVEIPATSGARPERRN
jgi:trans-2,3-dihydro-3-hydroxyanthranilate isomerase